MSGHSTHCQSLRDGRQRRRTSTFGKYVLSGYMYLYCVCICTEHRVRVILNVNNSIHFSLNKHVKPLYSNKP